MWSPDRWCVPVVPESRNLGRFSRRFKKGKRPLKWGFQLRNSEEPHQPRVKWNTVHSGVTSFPAPTGHAKVHGSHLPWKSELSMTSHLTWLKSGLVRFFRLSELEFWLRGAFPMKRPTWRSEIPTSEYNWNAPHVHFMSNFLLTDTLVCVEYFTPYTLCSEAQPMHTAEYLSWLHFHIETVFLAGLALCTSTSSSSCLSSFLCVCVVCTVYLFTCMICAYAHFSIIA